MCWQVRAFTITTPLASISLLAVSRGNSVPVSPVPQAQQELNNTAVFADTGGGNTAFIATPVYERWLLCFSANLGHTQFPMLFV